MTDNEGLRIRAVRWLARRSCIGLTSLKVLLVREDHEQTIAHFPVSQDPIELLPCLIYTISVLRINDEDQSLSESLPFISISTRSSGNAHTSFSTHLRPRIVMPPKRSDLVLPANVPDIEFDILVCHGFDVEPDRGNGGNALIEFELVKDG